MSRLSMIGRAFGIASIALCLAGGCGSKPSAEPTDPNLQIHKIQSLSKEELNAPLSNKGRSRGAQVAPPPIR